MLNNARQIMLVLMNCVHC